MPVKTNIFLIIALFFIIFFSSFAYVYAYEYSDIVERVQKSVCKVIVKTNDGVVSGSCFVVDERGFVVTNYHVIDGASEINEIRVIFMSPRGKDKEYLVEEWNNIFEDGALLKLLIPNKETIQPLPIEDSFLVRKGDEVFVLGYPIGYSPYDSAFTAGYIAQVYDPPKNPFGPLELRHNFRIDFDISPGNSGGPLFNKDGEVIGITTAMMPYVPNYFNVFGKGIVIPSNIISQALLKLRKAGKIIKRGALPIILGDDPKYYSYFLNKEHSTSVRVLKSSINGILPDDRIFSINGFNVMGSKDVVRYARFINPGNIVPLCVLRSVEQHCVDVTIGGIEEKNIFYSEKNFE